MGEGGQGGEGIRGRGGILRTVGRLIVGLLIAGPAAAAEVHLTLEEAIDRARTEAATLRELEARRTAADAGVREARAARQPEVSARAGYTRLSDVPELAIPTPGQGVLTVFPNIPDNYSAAVDLTVPLYTGGRIAGLVDAAAGQAEAAGEDLAAGGADLVLEVTAAYWRLVVAREREAVLARAIESFDAHLKDVETRQRFGMAARNEVLAVEVERRRAELDQLTAAGETRIAAADLARLLALGADTQIVPAQPLKLPAPEAEPLEALVDEALERRPELRAVAARRAAAGARVRVEEAGRRPQVAASAGYLYAQPNRNVLPPEETFRDTWSVGVGVRLELFDGGRRKAAAARAAAEEEALGHRLDDFERRIRLEVTARRVELETARARVAVAEGAVEAARANLEVAGDRYREGLIPSSERLDAETALLRAELDRTAAVAGVRLAAARLERSVGR